MSTSTVASVVAGRPLPRERTAGTRTSCNPARLADAVAEVELADAAGFAAACTAAAAGQRAWADTPAPVRGRTIAAAGRLVEANAERLAGLVTREIGKPYAEALGEVREIVDTCDFFLGEGRRLYGQTVPSEMPDKQLLTFREPVGVVAVVTAGNFPVAVPAWYIVPALLCGNAVVWKPAEYAAASAAALYELLSRAGLPEGVLNIVHADGEQTFAGLEKALAEGTVDKIGFTGSSEVGVRIGELAGRHLQSPCLELGGKNPLVVAPDADLDLAVEGALFSGFGSAGQRCTSLGSVIVHESVAEEFLRRFTAAVDAAVVGDPTGPVLYGPLLDRRFADRFEEYLGWIRPHHTLHGTGRPGRITAENPRAGFAGDAQGGTVLPPRRGLGCPSRRQDLPRGDVRAAGGRDHLPGVRRGGGAGQRTGLRPVGGRLHERRAHCLHLPAPCPGRNDQREQLDFGCRGPPALRGQRPVRQRVEAVGHLGARSVHPVAVHELGLFRPASEGTDGHRRDGGRPRLPAARLMRRR